MQCPKSKLLMRVSIVAVLCWTAVLACLLTWNIWGEAAQTTAQASHQARTFFKEFLLARFWNAMHGGVYVPITDDTQPNPYLDDPLRDVTTLEGLKLTKMNPSYMTRQIASIAVKRGEFHFHITSLNPIRPENKPDPWERVALQAFKEGKAEFYGIVSGEEGVKLFRYMGPLYVEEACLDCHAKYGTKAGEINGGISVTMLAGPLLASQNRQILFLSAAYVFIWVFGLFGIWISFCRLEKEAARREEAMSRMEEALGEVKNLSGLLPICSSCKKIRDDKGYWQQLEKYIGERSTAQFSHGICPECAESMYPGLLKRIKEKKQEKKSQPQG